MFELSIALKYLVPHRRQLSVSIISLISVLVIALVVWLTVVFFSVSYGLEKSWVQKLIALAAPVRVVPTNDYYRSYYYLIDSISAHSNYDLKSIGQKLATSNSNPYDPEFDQELPVEWASADLNADGSLKDLVKLAFTSIQNISGIEGIQSKEYEMAVGNLQLHRSYFADNQNEVTISQSIYLSSYDPSNPSLLQALLPFNENDFSKIGKKKSKFWLTGSELPSSLPSTRLEEGILVPKSFLNAGVLLGDHGYISYYSPSASIMQEHQIPVMVLGFYDPGILPIAGKVVIVNSAITSMIREAYQQEGTAETNGINVRFRNFNDAEKVKAQIVAALEKEGIDRYWKVETYRDFEFSRDLLQQLHSEKNLFRLISAIIILVACSNIISMLIILVNDKKLEIGILRSMGATSASIAFIFGFCGIIMGMIGSTLGTIAALITLKNLDSLIGFISKMQGFDVFNPMFYGESLPNEVSVEALTFVLSATVATSLIAGIVPAVKACLLHPSQILRLE
ncbi:MAG TPA: FtsX-like permease family protein [Waddliaceae bacterium]